MNGSVHLRGFIDIRSNTIEKRENEWQFVDGDGGKSVDETVHVGGVLVTDGGENVVSVDLVDTGERGGEGCHAGLDVCGVRRNI